MNHLTYGWKVIHPLKKYTLLMLEDTQKYPANYRKIVNVKSQKIRISIRNPMKKMENIKNQRNRKVRKKINHWIMKKQQEYLLHQKKYYQN